MTINYGDPPNPLLPSHRTLTYFAPWGKVIDCKSCEEKFSSDAEHEAWVEMIASTREADY